MGKYGGRGASLVFHHIAGENLLVGLVRVTGGVIQRVIVVVVMRVRQDQADRFQLDMPSRRAPGDGEQEGWDYAKPRHHSGLVWTSVIVARRTARTP